MKLEELVQQGELPEGSEIFLFTDNSTAESAMYKGTSSSKLLFDLVMRLRKLEMQGSIFLHIIWVAGKRMIAQGTDGLSRGDLGSGVMAGASMLDYVPINKSALERQPELTTWLKDLLPGSWRFLEPDGWFDDCFSKGNFIWSPPPAAADAALDQLCESFHCRPDNGHIFVCPSLMTSRWRKKLGKVSDIIFHVPVGCRYWKKEQYESLMIGIVCPLLTRRPWQARLVGDIVAECLRNLSGVWGTNPGAARGYLREFWRGAGIPPSV
jgi:hypothetical protein